MLTNLATVDGAQNSNVVRHNSRLAFLKTNSLGKGGRIYLVVCLTMQPLQFVARLI